MYVIITKDDGKDLPKGAIFLADYLYDGKVQLIEKHPTGEDPERQVYLDYNCEIIKGTHLKLIEIEKILFDYSKNKDIKDPLFQSISNIMYRGSFKNYIDSRETID